MPGNTIENTAYYTYWSILDTPSYAIKPYHVALVTAVIAGLLWIYVKRYKKDNQEGDKQTLLWGTGAFSILGIAMFVFTTFVYPNDTDIEFADKLSASSTLTVEGVVSDFQRTFRSTRFGTVTNESFAVDSVHFSYGNELLGRFGSYAGVNNSVICNGERVRITYRKKDPSSILKIEIPR